jgi:hypothetical protein
VAALRSITLTALLTAAALASAVNGAQAGEAASAHRSWRQCLGNAYVSGIALTGRDLATDAALRACRGEESAYLTALSASPLLDGDDIAQVRPELVARVRAQLIDTVTAGPRSVLR